MDEINIGPLSNLAAFYYFIKEIKKKFHFHEIYQNSIQLGTQGLD